MATAPRLLLDTNVFIPLEPLAAASIEERSRDAIDLARRAQSESALLLLHPAQQLDLARDGDEARRSLRRRQFERYPKLESPPPIAQRIRDQLGDPEAGTNDWVDHALLSAVLHNAVDLLVTEDAGIHAKARRIGLSDRVVHISEARSLFITDKRAFRHVDPALRRTLVHEISVDDPILSSFREDYGPDFDKWWATCQKERRTAYVITGDQAGIAAFAVINPERKSPPAGLNGRILKICSFKVSERFTGIKLGELLLKAVLRDAQEDRFDFAFVTAFPKQVGLIALFQDHGFELVNEKTKLGELELVKALHPPSDESIPSAITPLEYHVRYGPRHFRRDVQWHFVPIRPEYSDVLFPESSIQPSVFAGRHPYGNAIRKAYLCHANIRSLSPGDVIAFYRSQKRSGVIAFGVLESAHRATSAEEVVQLVARRTVYTLAEIREMTTKEVLVLRFREALALASIITARELASAGLPRCAPQSIMRIGEERAWWLIDRAARSRSSR